MSVPTLETSPAGWLDGPGRRRLESEVLPAYLARQRWFAGKARGLDTVRIADTSEPGAFAARTAVVLVEARYGDGQTDLYLLPLRLAEGEEACLIERDQPARALARIDGGALLHEAVADDATCTALLDAIANGREVPTRSGRLRAFSTTAFAAARGPADAPLPVRRGSAEQSNSALIYGDRLILKLFRRLEPGLNPDLEIGRFLSERTRFDRIPQAAGSIEYDRPGDEPITVAILQGLVRNEGTGWEHALKRLEQYYKDAAARSDVPPDPSALSPLELADSEPPAALREIAGEDLDDAATLGRRTAEMHLALASVEDDPAFRPEPLSPDDLRELAADVREQVERALATLRQRLPELQDPVDRAASLVLSKAPGLLRTLDALPSMAAEATKTRVHGDYHLGQVLRTGRDYVLLDFEGEPARPLAKRKAKYSPLKDVVGMLRSFDYAAYAGLFAAAEGDPSAFERLAPWARAWQAGTSSAFLRAYLDTAAGASFLPSDRGAMAFLLRAFLLDKALYELLYELNNRPDWVRIPLHGILSLIEPARDDAPTTPRGSTT